MDGPLSFVQDFIFNVSQRRIILYKNEEDYIFSRNSDRFR